MRKYILILLCILSFVPILVQATTSTEEAMQTKVKDLKETVEDLDLTFKGTNYKETDDQVTVYLFRMQNCNHCHDAVSFFNDIVEEYGDKFKLRSFDISSVEANNNLYNRVINYLNIKEGVPLILIGKSTFRGFPDSTKEKIKKAIDSNYENKTTYDIFEEIENSKEKKKKSASVIMFLFLGLASIIIVFIFAKKEKTA